MENTLEKRKNKEYNLDIVNIYEICENDNPYGHIKEFMNLDYKTKFQAHRVISSKALKLFYNNKTYGSCIDVNGNSYDFEIFSDSSYRITNIEKYKESIKEVSNEKYIAKDC